MKKIIIWTSSIIGVIGLLVISLFTLFGLKYVNVKFHSETSIFSNPNIEKNIVESGQFAMSSPVFFLSKQLHIDKLERSNPYLKVVNLEINFPNSITIHATEREEFYSIISDSKQFILDNELKVLKINSSEHQNNCINLAGVNVPQSVSVGEFLQVENGDALKNLSPSFLLVNRDIAMQKSLIDSVEIYKEASALNLEYTPTIVFVDNVGMQTKITDAHQFLEEKIVTYFDFQEKITPTSSTKILIYENLNGEIVATIN